MKAITLNLSILLLVTVLQISSSFPQTLAAHYGEENEVEQWWKHTLLYEILLPSFKDSNGDGIGDINGVIMKLDYLKELHVDTIWLTPFTKTPFRAIGYDVTNFCEIDPLFGTMADFERLLYELKKRGMRLIFDLILNHSSDEHPWFIKSVNKVDPYTDYYIWKDPKGYDSNNKPIPPNNWTALFNGQSMWDWNAERKQFYLHQFVEYMPDLDLRNPNVIKEFQEIMRFWIDKGVDGFRLDAIPHYMEDQLFRDEPLKDPAQTGYIDWGDIHHIHTFNHPDSFTFIHQLRTFLDENFNNDHSLDARIFVGESVQNRSVNIHYYGNVSYPITHYSFAFELELLECIPTSNYLDFIITNWLKDVNEIESTVNWVTATHDRPRISNRLFEEMNDPLIILSMMLPGAVTIYYGQELGMSGRYLKTSYKSDMFVTERLPMQWDDSPQAGFTTNRTSWLPLNPNYWAINVKHQKTDRNSQYQMFKKLSQLRKEPVVRFGEFNSYIISEFIYCFTRRVPGKGNYIVVLFNLNVTTEIIDLKSHITDLPRRLYVITSSVNTGLNKEHVFKSISSKNIEMRPITAIVFSTRRFRFMEDSVVAINN